MKILLATVASVAVLSAAPAIAQTATEDDAMRGDPAAGQTLFQRQCTTCHVIADGEGEILAGRPTGAGPNLYGVMGAPPATQHDFTYSDALVAYGETGTIWEHDNMASYLEDPTAHLREALDDPRARSRMVFRVRGEEQKNDIIAFLAQHGQQETPEDNGEDDDQADDNDDG